MAKEPQTVKDYASLGYEKLHKELLKMVEQAERSTVRFNTDKQLRLLPALTAMKSLVAQPGRRFLVAGQPGWEDECRSLGLTAEQVRQWKKRTASDMSIGALLGEEKSQPKKCAPAMTQEYRRMVMLAKAVVDGEEAKAEKIAQAIVEEYGV
jgi:hypothetical protein